MRSRPQTVTAAVLLALFSVLNLLFPFFPIEEIPAVALYLGIVLGTAGLLGAAGLWMLRKWGLAHHYCVCLTSGMQRQG